MDDAHTPPTPPHLPTDKPSVARMYDYYLGGHHNFAIDRAAAEAVLAIAPDIGLGARANRAFLRRVVRFLVARGVAQFLDVGAGIPTVGNTHEVAGAADPAARVVYVDIDPVAVAHARAILGDHPYATAIAADAREPAALLAHPAVRGLLDFERPVAVLLLAFLHLLPDDDEARRVVAAFVAALPPGGYLAIAHATVEGASPAQIAQIERLYAGTTTPATFRPRAAIAAFFAGLELVEPGLVPAPLWHPEAADDVLLDAPARSLNLVGLGRKP